MAKMAMRCVGWSVTRIAKNAVVYVHVHADGNITSQTLPYDVMVDDTLSIGSTFTVACQTVD